MRIWAPGELVGRVDLNPVAPGSFVLCYWLGYGHPGSGYATVACRALLEYGRTALRATDFWAGVTHGNRKSVSVLERLGFSAVEELEHYTRFHLRVARP